jgi:hypothetical protein
MNFALPSIFFLILLLPGLFYRIAFYSDAFPKDFIKLSFTENLIPIIIPSVIIHGLLSCIISISNYYIDDHILAIIISGTDDPSQLSALTLNIYDYFPEILLYFFITIFLGWLTGNISRFVIRKNKFDRRFRLFRYKNDWFYILTGEILDYPLIPGNSDDIDFIYIDALVDTNEGSIIYSGILAEFKLSKEDGLDLLYLTEVRRRYLKDVKKTPDAQQKEQTEVENQTEHAVQHETIELISSSEQNERYFDLPGQLFVLSFNKIVNLHITYYSIEINLDFENELSSESID